MIRISCKWLFAAVVAVCAGAVESAGADVEAGMETSRIARVGIMTDTHVQKTMESCSRVKSALELFRRQGVEMVINCGGIADCYLPEGYCNYRTTVNAVYPEASARPKEVFVYAGHDVCGFRKGGGWSNLDRDVPAAGTTFHSRHWGCDQSRRILNRYPQVVQISGHVHGSLKSERQIWQGAFTAVNAG